jgi:endonuclease YncB( thermonuclease family)
MRIRVVILAAMTLVGAPAQAGADLSGIPRIVDGNTLIIGPTKIRLARIYAPETDQICLNAKSIRWTCGIEARDQLAEHIAGREIICTSTGVDEYRRTLATCSLAGEDLNGWMVEQGWALPYFQHSFTYVRAEENARSQQRGLWQGAFIAPWDWRRRNNMTSIMGMLKEPNAQSMLLGPSASANAPSPECTIKGSVTRAGRRIYYTPNQKSYAKVRMDKGVRRWFCAPEEAEAAGWRKALR